MSCCPNCNRDHPADDPDCKVRRTADKAVWQAVHLKKLQLGEEEEERSAAQDKPKKVTIEIPSTSRSRSKSRSKSRMGAPNENAARQQTADHARNLKRINRRSVSHSALLPTPPPFPMHVKKALQIAKMLRATLMKSTRGIS